MALVAGQPAPLAELVGQLASTAPGTKVGWSCLAGRPRMWGSPGSCSVWPALCLPDAGPVGQLSGSACLRLCLNLELSVSLCLTASLLCVRPDLPFCPLSGAGLLSQPCL